MRSDSPVGRRDSFMTNVHLFALEYLPVIVSRRSDSGRFVKQRSPMKYVVDLLRE